MKLNCLLGYAQKQLEQDVMFEVGHVRKALFITVALVIERREFALFAF